MDVIIKHKKTIIALLIAVLLVVIFGDNLPFANSNKAEKVSIEFVESMLDGDAKKCVKLMSDDLIAMADYETEKLFINAFDKKLDALIESCKDKYGKRWKYEVSVIDSFEYIPEYYEYEGNGELFKVVLEIEHKGGGLFNKKEGKDEIELIVERKGNKCLVYDLPI